MPWDDASAGSEKGTTNIPPADELPTQASPHVHTGFSSLPLFHRDQLVAGRFKILRLIGQGGMGAVYEAEDQELGGRIALKTVRPEATADPRIVERFKQEIYLARKVTHPNVCRIFDLFHHQPSPSERPIVFLTMEMLPGETLAQRLRRTGRMQPAEALPLVRHMAAALSAAHQAGIVHRDFKPSNVVLVPSKDSPEGVRAVVTDFGLAHTSSADSSVVLSVTGTGEVVGSPAYMAPEQLGAEETTAAADIYALGVVMYEMVAGQPPFSGDTPFAVAVQRLQRPAASPRSFVPDLDATWEAVILRCLERRSGRSIREHGGRRERARRRESAGGAARRATTQGVDCGGDRRRGSDRRIRRVPSQSRSGWRCSGSDRRIPDQAAPRGRRARLQEPVAAIGRGVAVDGALRDADLGAGRGREAPDDSGRTGRPDEDGSRARRRRELRDRHAGADSHQPRHGPGRARIVRRARREGRRADPARPARAGRSRAARRSRR